MPFTETERGLLLEVATASIRHGLEHGSALIPRAEDYPSTLQALRASFVTLHLAGELRGCIGALQAREPVVCDVARHAHAAAFQDPRFSPLSEAEFHKVDLHLSILGVPEPIRFSDEADLIRQLRPGEDGLILTDGAYQGTFLPSVWESLPTPELFWRQLKRKAGLSVDHWTPTLRVSRYYTESFGRS